MMMASSFMRRDDAASSSNLAIRFHEALGRFRWYNRALTGHNDIEGL